ncbi:MAG: PaaI family thioesterase [Burkholderiaceae bacterium]|nr:PaaI family thioesterase [Burkholderiaceae bacterium]
MKKLEVPPEQRAFTLSVPFARLLGFELRHFKDGESEIYFAPKPEHLNTFDVTHGGACMTLLDITMATAARSAAPESGIVTIEMKTSFMLPSIGPLTARGQLLHRTASMAFVEATIFDPHGRACAKSSGTFKYVKRPVPAGAGAAAAVRPLPTD